MFFLQTLTLLLPILASGVFLIIVIKYKFFPRLSRPVDNGIKFRGRPLFGSNKTWRGILIYIIGSIIICCALWLGINRGFVWVHSIFGNNPFVLGSIFGISYSMGELVNSFVKRRLRIRPGKSTGFIQHVFDTIDGILFTIITLSILYGANWGQLILVLFLGTLIHLSTDFVMKKHKLKK